MATQLADVVAYWNSDSILSAIPLYYEFVPTSKCFPYAVITPIYPGKEPEFITGGQGTEYFIYQVNVYTKNDPFGADQLAGEVACRLDFCNDLLSLCSQGIIGMGGGLYMANRRIAGPILIGKADTQEKIWAGMVRYEYTRIFCPCGDEESSSSSSS